MNFITNHLIRRVLTHSQVENYVEGISSAKIDIVRSNGWIPKELEVAGPLYIKPLKLREKACIDKPGVVELEGGRVDRIIVKIPEWVRNVLVQFACLPFKGKRAEDDRKKPVPASSARSILPTEVPHPAGDPDIDNLFESFGSVAVEQPFERPRSYEAGGKLHRGPELLPAVVPPKPLVLPGDEDKSSGISQEQEKVRVELHGLRVDIRSFTQSEISEMKGEIAREALQTLFATHAKPQVAQETSRRTPPPHQSSSCHAGASSASCSTCGRPREESLGSESVGADSESGFNALMHRLYEHICIECFGVDVHLEIDSSCMGHLQASKLELLSLFRFPEDSNSLDCWFGEPTIPTPNHGIVELRGLDAKLTVGGIESSAQSKALRRKSGEWRADSGSADEDIRFTDEAASLEVGTLVLGFLLPIPPQIPIDESKRPPPAPPDEPLNLGIRVASMDGTRLSLPGGVDSLAPVLKIVETFMIGCIACDPNTLASEYFPSNVKEMLRPDERMDFVNLWRRDFENRYMVSSVGEQYSFNCAPMCSRHRTSSHSKGQSLELTEEEKERLSDLLQKIPLALQASLLQFGDDSTELTRLQEALCLVFCDRFKPASIKLAVEFGKYLVIEMDGLTSQEHFLDIVANESVKQKPSPTSPKRIGVNLFAPAESERRRSTSIQFHFVGGAFYLSAYQVPSCWKKNMRVLMQGLGVRIGSSCRPLLLCHTDPQQLDRRQGISGVSAFRTMAKNPAIAIEVLTGCFAPEGRAGARPWLLDLVMGADVGGNTSHRKHTRRRCRTETVSDLPSDVSSSVLSHYLVQPEQPPRMVFLNFAFESALQLTLWPHSMAVLMVLGQSIANAGLQLSADFVDATFPKVSAIPVQAVIKSIDIKLQDNAETDVCLVVGLSSDSDHGLRLEKSPLSLVDADDFQIEVSLRGISASCTTFAREVRPVLALIEYVGIVFSTENSVIAKRLAGPAAKVNHTQAFHTKQYEADRKTLLKVDIQSPKIRLDISPQLGVVVTTLVDEASPLIEVANSMSSNAAASEGGKATSVDEDSNGSDVEEQRSVQELRLEFIMDPLMVNLCDAISALLRVSLNMCAEATLKTYGNDLEDMTQISASVRVPHMMGEFASHNEGMWEPFLEPWSMGVDFRYCLDHGVELLISDGTSLTTITTMYPNRKANPEQEEDDSQSHRNWESWEVKPRSLRLNMTTQLIRACMCLSQQFEEFQETAAPFARATNNEVSKNKKRCLPLYLEERVPVLATDFLGTSSKSHKEGRISALNMSGNTVDAWFHLGNGLRAARNEAIEVHWKEDDENEIQNADISLPGLSDDQPSNPRALDPHIQIPAFTVLVLRMRKDPTKRPSYMSLASTERKERQLKTGLSKKLSSMVPSVVKRILSQRSFVEEAKEEDQLVGTTMARYSSVKLAALQTGEDEQLNEQTSRAWPRKDNKPIMPLSAGWCIVISSSRMTLQAQARLNADLERPTHSGWLRDEMIVQILAPKPAHRLVLIGSPFRFFNYTDKDLFLAFKLREKSIYDSGDCIDFSCSPEICRHATAPASLLGCEQPYNPQWLGLPPSPLEQSPEISRANSESEPNWSVSNSNGSVRSRISMKHGIEEHGLWPLPPNSFCCVPTPDSFRTDDDDFLFMVSSNCNEPRPGNGWSEEVCPTVMKHGDWYSLDCTDEFFRVACFFVLVEKPYPVEVINIVILPAFSVINITPAVLGVDVCRDEQVKRNCCNCCRYSKPKVEPNWHLPQYADPEDIIKVKLSPGKTKHFYDVSSTQPLRMQVCFPADPPELDEGSYWSEVVHDVCGAKSNRETKRIELKFDPPFNSAALEVNCVDLIATVSCPMWLMNGTSMSLYAGRQSKIFPFVRGVSILGGMLTDIKLYLYLKTNEDNTRSSGAIPSSPGGNALKKKGIKLFNALQNHAVNKKIPEAVLKRLAQDNQHNDGRKSQGEEDDGNQQECMDVRNAGSNGHRENKVLICAFNVPVASTVTQSCFQAKDVSRYYNFTVVRDELPKLYGELSTPTTCFHIVPTVMISNRTDVVLHVRQQAKTASADVLLPIPAGDSAPFWGNSGPKEMRRLQIQLTPPGEEPISEAWSTDILCESVANGRYALAMQRWGEPDTLQTSDSDSTNASERISFATPFGAPQVLSVEISDALEGVVSLSVTKQACLLVGCWCNEISSFSIETDSPPGAAHKNSKRTMNIHTEESESANFWTGVRNATAATAQSAQNAATRMKAAATPGRMKVIQRVKTDDLERIIPRGKAKSRASTVQQRYQIRGTIGWPLQIGWYEPFKNRQESYQSLSVAVIIKWFYPPKSIPGGPGLKEDNSVRINLGLGRVTPLVLLRVHVDSSGIESQKAIMLRIRPRAKKFMESHARELRVASQSMELKKSLNLKPAERARMAMAHAPKRNARKTAAKLEQAWLSLSHGSPDLIEIRETTLESIGDLEVEWACGECGESCKEKATRKDRRIYVPHYCGACKANLVPDPETAPSETYEKLEEQGENEDDVLSPRSPYPAEAKFRSPSDTMPPLEHGGALTTRLKLDVHLRRIDVSIVSEREQSELLFGGLNGIWVHLERNRGQELGKIQLKGFRFDCQPRIIQRRALEMQKMRRCGHLRQRLKRNAAVEEKRKNLIETPAIIANVGAKNADASVRDYIDQVSCVHVEWDRPAALGEGATLCMKRFCLQMNHRWEIVIDDIAALAAIGLHSEIETAIAQCKGQPGGRQTNFMFNKLLDSSRYSFEDNFVPIGALPVVQVEDLQISDIEVGLWGCIVLSNLPVAAMPTSLVFLLKVLALSDTLYVEGSTCRLKDTTFKPLEGSQMQVQGHFKSKYKGDFIRFFANSVGASNVLGFLKVTAPLSIMSAALNDLKDVALAIDLSPLTFDREYIEERREKKDENVASLEEGMLKAAECLRDGVIGMADVLMKPQKQYRKRGIWGVPRGCCQGFLGAIVKPLDAIYQALVVLAKGCCACRIRGRGEDSDDEQVVDELDGGSRTVADISRTSKFWKNEPTARTTNSSGGHGNKKKPALFGAECLRLPRLLFGEAGTIVPFVEWHGELVAKLGDLAHGICNAWYLAGSESKVVHIILCATHTNLLIVDLNRTAHRNAKQRAHKARVGPNAKAIHTDQMLEMLEASVEQLKKDRRQAEFPQKHSFRGLGTAKTIRSKTIATADTKKFAFKTRQFVSFISTAPILVKQVQELKRLQSRVNVQRCWCCQRRRATRETADMEGVMAQKVLGSWPWVELQSCQISDMALGYKGVQSEHRITSYTTQAEPLTQAPSSRPTSVGMAQSTTSGTVIKQATTWRPDPADCLPLWTLQINTIDDNQSTEWPLPCVELSPDELHKVCRGVNEAIREFRAFS